MKRSLGKLLLVLALSLGLVLALASCDVIKGIFDKPSDSCKHTDYDGDGVCDECEVELCAEHLLGQWETVTEPTCLTEGVKSRSCTACGAVVELGEVAKLSSHRYDYDNICSVCGKVYPASKGLEFVPKGDNTCYVSHVGSFEGGYLYIPLTSPTGEVVSEIGHSVFRDNQSITGVCFPDTVTKIGEYAFRDCKNIEEVTFGSGLTTIKEEAFYNCSGIKHLVIPDSTEVIGHHAFRFCNSIESLEIGKGIKSIGMTAFDRCKNLERVTFDDECELSMLESSLFSGCERLSNITLPKSITKIGYRVFDSCSMRSIVIPDSVRIIEVGAFSTCTALESVTFGEQSKLEELGIEAFYACKLLPEVHLPDTVRIIGESAFRGCTGITSMVIPDSVTEIGANAFSGCSSLGSITLGEGVERIGDGALASTALSEITIPAGVKIIGRSAFYGCTKLSTVKFVVPDGWTYFSLAGGPLTGDIDADALRSGDTASEYLLVDYVHCTWSRP